MNNYEGVFIVNPSLSQEDLEKKSASIQEAITKQGGEVREVQSWGKKRLAYQIKKNQNGVYLLVSFRADPLALEKLYKNYKMDDNILRCMITKVNGSGAVQ